MASSPVPSFKPANSGPVPERHRQAWLLIAIAIAAVLAAYSNTFSGPFIFDDLPSIPQNPTIGSLLTSLSPPGGGVTVTGRPFLNVSFAFNHALSGEHVWSYHALNLLIHLLAGLALFGIVRRTLRLSSGQALRLSSARTFRLGSGQAFASGDAMFVAFSVALLWALHPLQTESVTYIVQRAESLMGLFYLLTLYCFIRGAEPAENFGPPSIGPVQPPKDSAVGREEKPKAGSGWFVLSFVACLLGMATKEVMVSAPVIVLLYDRTFLGGSFLVAWRRRGRVHAALAATWILLLGLVLHAANRGGTAGIGVGVGFWTYAATQSQAVSHYLWLSVWPHPLIIDYGVRWVASVGEVAPYAAGIALLVAVTAVALVRRPALGFLGVVFFAILAPTSLVPGTRQTLAEHRMYLALVPVIVLIVLAAYTWLGRRSGFVLAAAAVVLGSLTFQRNTVYRSDAAIWSDTVAGRPINAIAHNNYGNVLAQAGRPGEALAQYAEAIRLDPGYAEAFYNAGIALAHLGRVPEAIDRFEEALHANPKMPDAQTALGIAMQDSGRADEAVAHFEQALRIDPNYADAHNRLGIALTAAGRFPEAVAHFEQALHINPALSDVQNNLGSALRACGRLPEALAHFEEALRLQPDFAQAHSNLGSVLGELNRLPESIAQFELALHIDPSAPDVHNKLGMVLLMAGRSQEAIAQFEQALRLNPDLAQVHVNLAMALESVGRSGDAAAHYEAARRLGLDVSESHN